MEYSNNKDIYCGVTASLKDMNLKNDISKCSKDDDDGIEEHNHKRLQLVNFGHNQWGFKNWSWSVTKQELDFVDESNNKVYSVGVAAYVLITVKSLSIERENIGYATCCSSSKGLAIQRARKMAVTNALYETYLSFGGKIALAVQNLFANESVSEETTTVANNSVSMVACANQSARCNKRNDPPANKRADWPSASAPPPGPTLAPTPAPPPGPPLPPTMIPPPAPPGPGPAAAAMGSPRHSVRPPGPFAWRAGADVSVMVPAVCGAARLAAPVFPECYGCAGAWHVCGGYERLPADAPQPAPPPRNHPRGAPPPPAPPAPQGCWIKPTIFYDGFWTEQKVRKWVAEQVEKRFPDEASSKSTSPRPSADACKS